MTIWQLIQRNRQRKTETKAKEERMKHPLDTDLPLKLHLDGKVEINPILPQGMVATFPTGPSIVQGYSKSTINGKTCFRVLLEHEENHAPSYFLIFQDEGGELVRWFVGLDEVKPQSKDDWDFWLNDKDGSIGLSAFQSKEPEKILYNRLWVPDSVKRLEPVVHKETILLDRFDGAQTKTVQHQSMLYGRHIEDEVSPCDELILLSVSNERDASYVSIDAGVDLSSFGMKVIY